MGSLNGDIQDLILEMLFEDPYARFTLHSCLFLNREFHVIAVKYLYKDPWTYLRGADSPIRASKLITTYLHCLQTSTNVDKNSGEPSSKKLHLNIVEEHRGNQSDTSLVDGDTRTIPTWDYVEITRNLHIPALYECVVHWRHTSVDEENETEDEEIYINRTFFNIFRAFIQKAKLQECTFADSMEKPYPPPTTVAHLNELAIGLHARNIKLEYLNLGYFKCNDEALGCLTGKITHLKTFKVKAQHCSDEALAEFIRSQQALVKLKIRNGKNIHRTISALGSLSKTLVKLRILGCNLESCSEPFQGIADCTKLRSLYMTSVKFQPNVPLANFLMPIAENCIFHNIDFSKTVLPDIVLAEIAKNSGSTLIKVIGGRPDNGTQENCALGISALGIYASNLKYFERNILPSEVEAMIGLLDSVGHSLNRLDIGSIDLASIDTSDLICAIGRNCRELTILDISFYNFSEDSFEQIITGCTKLQDLTFFSNPSINYDLLVRLAKGSQGPLQTLKIAECHNINFEEIKLLEELVEDVESDLLE
ncbi:hypothetical protein G9A89_018993 [Geosiphon pyriformis]|nr:hypothetical protein G9A89_018993 [Geosiphon pyriformis]